MVDLRYIEADERSLVIRARERIGFEDAVDLDMISIWIVKLFDTVVVPCCYALGFLRAARGTPSDLPSSSY